MTATSLLNAQEIAGGETGDSLIDSAVATQRAFESLNASIETVISALATKLAPAIEKIAGLVEGAPMTALGVGAGAALLGSGLGRGALSLGARGAGLGARGLAAGVGAAGAAPIAAGVAIGTAGALAIDTVANDGVSIFEELARVKEAQRVALSQTDRLAAIAKQNEGTLTGRKQSLTARLGRFELENQRSVTAQFFGYDLYSEEDQRTIERMRNEIAQLAQQINKAKDEAQSATEQADKLRQSEEALTAERKESERIQRLQQQAARRAEIEGALGVAGAEAGLAREMINAAFIAPFQDLQVPLNPEQQAYQAKLLHQITKLEALLSTIDTSTEKGQVEAANIKTEVSRLRNEQARQSQMAFQLQMADYADKLNILRLQYQVQSTTPIGVIGALDSLRDLQRGLAQEIERIRERITELREKGSDEALREARKLEQTVLGLELELRQLRLQAMQALLDSVVQQAFNMGSFEKILITQNQNLGLALEKGLIEARPYITGLSGQAAIDHTAHPRSALDVYRQAQTGSSNSGQVSRARSAAEGAKDLVGVAAARLKIRKNSPVCSAMSG
jgi:hypothetical protein